MNKPAKKDRNKKIIILGAIILAVIAIFGITVASTGGGSGQSAADHGHSHD
ncbi:MAG: hypothetical protein WBK55_08515 [Alphaproteobacteria bacterium]